MVVNPVALKNAANFYEENGEQGRAAAQRISIYNYYNARRRWGFNEYAATILAVATVAATAFQLYAAYTSRQN